MVAGLRRGEGATSFLLGLIVALRQRGISASIATIGSNLVDALVYRRLCQRPGACLDNRLLSEGQSLVSTYHASIGSECLLIDAGGGLFDGFAPEDMKGTPAAHAAYLEAPILLMVDGRGLKTGIAAYVKGAQELTGSARIIGGIAGRVQAEEVEAMLPWWGEALSARHLAPLLGVFPETTIESPGNASALQEQNTATRSRQMLIDLGNLVSERCDIDRIVGAAKSAVPLAMDGFVYRPSSRRCRIAVAEDACFGLAFQDNFSFLSRYGAQCVPFSPIADRQLPRDIGAVYLPGGFLSDYAEDLDANSAIRGAIADFYRSGGVVYSEGSGTAYLAKELHLPGDRVMPGIGILPGRAIYRAGRGPDYAEADTQDDSILGRAGLILKGLVSNEWTFKEEAKQECVLRIAPFRGAPMAEGFSPGAQVVATFGFWHFGSNPEVAKHLVDAAEVVRRVGGD